MTEVDRGAKTLLPLVKLFTFLTLAFTHHERASQS